MGRGGTTYPKSKIAAPENRASLAHEPRRNRRIQGQRTQELIDRWMDYLPDEKKSPNRSGIRLPRGRIVPPPSPASQLRRGGRIGGEEGGRGGAASQPATRANARVGSQRARC
jgi:hypothetical protein